MTMTVLVPITLTADMLISSSIAEDEYPLWDAGTTWADGDRVIDEHYVYESAAAGNLNHKPSTDTSDPPYWVMVQPTNLWACLDNSTLTATTALQTMTYVIKPGRIDTIALDGVRASSVYVKRESPVEGVIYEQTHRLPDRERASNWYNYFFAPIERDTLLEISGLPRFGEAETTVTLNVAAGAVALGSLLFGNRYDLGEVIYAPSVGIIDYTSRETNQYGVTTIVPGESSNSISLQMEIANEAADTILRLVQNKCMQRPCLWRGVPGVHKVLDLYAFVQDFKIVIPGPKCSVCSLELGGCSDYRY